MLPVFGVIGEGLGCAWRFARAYPAQLLIFVAVSAAASALGASGLLRLPLPPFLASQGAVWMVATLATVLMAPVWTALNRFAILGDTSRGWWPIDVRIRRVALAMLVLSVIGLIGATPFAMGLDVLPRIGPRRALALAAMAVAVAVRLGAWWLAARLAIAPAMAATGTRPQALDVAFRYTRRNAPRILLTRLIVYLPLLALIGILAYAGGAQQTGAGLGGLTAFGIAGLALTTLVTIATELVDGAVFARAAVALVKAQRAGAAERARKMRDGPYEDG